ncbi:type IV pilus assembly protein PilM [Sulfuritortus calidifontis]|uniref:Type IV pilus assembly protein PilM n=2 Tax=Sulfuritortus calidifontis TaxID=1914471 RepID=A0A4R3JW09_9PROT|nr:type IV pilus assembly protein PilM [Sulfuritortus calidifontis]
MLELASAGKGAYQVERYAIAALPKDAIADGKINKPEAVEAAMSQAWRSLDSRTRAIAMALPVSAVISKKILVPSQANENETEAQITAEANQMASFPVDEVSLDYQILGPSAKSPTDNEALVVITRRDRVDERVAIAEAVGLTTVIMDVDNFAVLGAYPMMAAQVPGSGKKQTVAIVDMGANFTHINILHSNQPVFQRTHAFGGQILTQDIARRFDVSLEEAEDAKRKGQLPDRYKTEVLPAFLENAAQEVMRSLQMCYAATAYQSVDHILLCGGCALLPGLDAAIRNATQANVIVANPLAQMGLSGKVDAGRLGSDAPMLIVACGLAMRRFDRT